jgi:hypothetical protein
MMTPSAESTGPDADTVARRTGLVHSAIYLVGYGSFAVTTAWATWSHGIWAGVAVAFTGWVIVAGPFLELSTTRRFRIDRPPSSVRESVRSFDFPFAALQVARGTVCEEWQTDDGRARLLRITMLRVFSGEYELRIADRDRGARVTIAADDECIVGATVTVEPADTGSEVTVTVRRLRPGRPRRLLVAALTSRLEQRFWRGRGYETVDSRADVGLWHL